MIKIKEPVKKEWEEMQKEELINHSRKQGQEYREGYKGSISNFERRNRKLESRITGLDQLVKLFLKNHLVPIKKSIRKIFYTKKEMKCK